MEFLDLFPDQCILHQKTFRDLNIDHGLIQAVLTYCILYNPENIAEHKIQPGQVKRHRNRWDITDLNIFF